MCYYTITSEKQNKDGYLQAIMIIDAENVEKAKQEYIKTFNLSECNISEGVLIPDGFQGLITEPIKKIICKHAAGRSGTPLISYCNRVEYKHDE